MSDSKRVAKNAVALTIRMVIATIVGLFTSRVVLQTLGVEDYGIYGVIGGVVGMASFLNSSMAGATSRFITFELGKGNKENLKQIFTTSLLIHIGIALIVAILAETAGLWFVNNKMNFPAGSMFAVNVLYQFTIVSMMVSFTQVPYTSMIIAHEKMDVYAYLEIINVALKLGIVYLLLITDKNRLILYGGLTLLVSVLSAMLYRIYCLRKFPESHFKYVYNKSLIKEMMTFSGYDIYRNMCIVVRNQGQPILLNIFFGVVANAAATLANTISGTITGLTTTVAQAFSPMITKTYARGDIGQMQVFMRQSVQFTLLAISSIAIPCIIKAETLLYLWLGTVPEYSDIFLQLTVISVIISVIISANNVAVLATGIIKKFSFMSGTAYLLTPVLSYIILKAGYLDANVIYITNILFMAIVAILSLRFIAIQIPYFNIYKYTLSILRSIGVIVIAYLPIAFIEKQIWLNHQSGWFYMCIDVVVITIIYALLLLFLTYTLVFSSYERNLISNKIKAIYLKLK